VGLAHPAPGRPRASRRDRPSPATTPSRGPCRPPCSPSSSCMACWAFVPSSSTSGCPPACSARSFSWPCSRRWPVSSRSGDGDGTEGLPAGRRARASACRSTGVRARQGMTVLDALVEVQRGTDPTLAFRYACRVGMCGSCGMVVNGRERWACRTLLSRLERGPVTVRPLYHFPLIRDLVVDMEPIKRKMLESKAVFVPRRPAEDDEGSPRWAATRASAAPWTAPSSASAAACASRPAPWSPTILAFPGPPRSTESSRCSGTAGTARMRSAARRSSPRMSSRAATLRPIATAVLSHAALAHRFDPVPQAPRPSAARGLPPPLKRRRGRCLDLGKRHVSVLI